MYWLLIIAYCLFQHPSLAHAQTISLTKTSDISASVPATSTEGGDDEAPTIPILISPPDGTITNNPRPDFVWERSTDPNGNYVVYALYQNDTAVYLQISDTGNSSGTGYNARIQDGKVHLTPTSDLPDGEYSWLVTASDLAGNTQESTTWYFTVDTKAPPLSVTQLGDVQDPIVDSSPTFDFTGPINLTFNTSSEPYAKVTVVLYNTTTGKTITLTDDPGDSSISYFLPYLALGQYEVFVSAVDQAGNTSSLPTFYLNIKAEETAGPTFPIPLPPLNIPKLSSLQATAMYVATRVAQAPSIYYLLALLPLLLLLARRKRNIRLLIESTDKPMARAKVYTKDNHEYVTDKDGYTYVPHLAAHDYLLIIPNPKRDPRPTIYDPNTPVHDPRSTIYDLYSLCVLKLAHKVTVIKL